MISKLLKKDKKGFTLMEMLIVVAIIAIIVAIAIPTFSNALTKAKVAADKANVRAYYAEVAANYMLAEDETAATAALGTAVTDATDLTVSGTGFRDDLPRYDLNQSSGDCCCTDIDCQTVLPCGRSCNAAMNTRRKNLSHGFGIHGLLNGRA